MAGVENSRAYKWLVDNDERLELPLFAKRSQPRRLLREIDRLSLFSIGSHRFYAEESRNDLERLQLSALDVIGACHRIPQLGQSFMCPSPWHAATLLYCLSLKLQARGSVLLFRGQADHRWGLFPSLFRVSPEERRLAEERLEGFATEFRGRPLPMGLQVDDSVARAAAQHFGLLTSLLDWTCDPLVAVWFAMARSHAPQETRKNGFPVVWMLPIEHLAGNGLHIPLPDPSVRRIYDQRGVLVDMSNPKTVWEDHAWKIIFDNCNANEPGFNPFWHGKGRKMYSPTRWVEGIASRQSPNFAPNLRFPRVDRGRWAGLAYEMIYSLTVTCNQLGEDVTVNTDVLHLIARQNPSIVRLLVDSLEEGNTDVDVSADLELARIMATLLA